MPLFITSTQLLQLRLSLFQPDPISISASLRSPSGCATPPRLSPVNDHSLSLPSHPAVSHSGRPRGQFGAALRAEATVGPVVVVTGRTAHWVSGQLVVADRDDLQLFGAARRSHRDDLADLCLQERRRDRRNPRDTLETRVTLPFSPVSGGPIRRDRCGRGALRPTARVSAPRRGRPSIGPRGHARPYAGRQAPSDSGRLFR
jgi:hypothetical protein